MAPGSRLRTRSKVRTITGRSQASDTSVTVANGRGPQQFALNAKKNRNGGARVYCASDICHHKCGGLVVAPGGRCKSENYPILEHKEPNFGNFFLVYLPSGPCYRAGPAGRSYDAGPARRACDPFGQSYREPFILHSSRLSISSQVPPALCVRRVRRSALLHALVIVETVHITPYACACNITLQAYFVYTIPCLFPGTF